MVKICPKNKKCAVIYGGGKDAHLTLLSAIKQGFEISCLITFDAGKTHYDFFSDLRKIEIVKQHAKLLNTKLFIFKITPLLQKSSLKKVFLETIKAVVKKYKINTIFAGNTEDPKEANIWREAGEIMKVKIKLPLEHKNIFEIIKKCEKNKIIPIIVAIEKNVDKKLLGQKMDKKIISYIKNERQKGNYLDGNDFQTLVIKSPLLKKEMKIQKTQIFSYDTTTYLKIDHFTFK